VPGSLLQLKKEHLAATFALFKKYKKAFPNLFVAFWTKLNMMDLLYLTNWRISADYDF
jgi:hypothetical protein